MEVYAAWLRSELDAMPGPVHLVAHDWGALLSLRVLADRPAKVASWVLDMGNLDDELRLARHGAALADTGRRRGVHGRDGRCVGRRPDRDAQRLRGPRVRRTRHGGRNRRNDGRGDPRAVPLGGEHRRRVGSGHRSDHRPRLAHRRRRRSVPQARQHHGVGRTDRSRHRLARRLRTLVDARRPGGRGRTHQRSSGRACLDHDRRGLRRDHLPVRVRRAAARGRSRGRAGRAGRHRRAGMAVGVGQRDRTRLRRRRDQGGRVARAARCRRLQRAAGRPAGRARRSPRSRLAAAAYDLDHDDGTRRQHGPAHGRVRS